MNTQPLHAYGIATAHYGGDIVRIGYVFKYNGQVVLPAGKHRLQPLAALRRHKLYGLLKLLNHEKSRTSKWRKCKRERLIRSRIAATNEIETFSKPHIALQQKDNR